MPDTMTGPTLALGIDARAAFTGARDFETAVGGIERAGGRADRAVRGVEGSFDRIVGGAKRASVGIQAFAGGLIGGIAGNAAMIAIGRLTQLPAQIAAIADAATRSRNSLALVLGSSQEAAQAFARLQNIAIATGADVGELSDIFFRTASAGKELGLSTPQVLQATESLTKFLSVAGGGRDLLQLGQAFGSARVQMEEFGSLIDTQPALLKFFADHIEGAAGSVNRLTQMVKEGRIAGGDLIRAVVLNGGEIERTYAAMPRTIGTAWSGLANVLETYVTDTDDASGASGRLVEAIDELAGKARDSKTDFIDAAAATVHFFANIRTEVDAAERRIEEFVGHAAYRRLLNLLEFGSGGYAARDKRLQETQQFIDDKRRQMGVLPGVTGGWQGGATGDWSDSETPAAAVPAPRPSRPVIITPTGPGLDDADGKSGTGRAADQLERMIESDTKLLHDFERQVALFGKARELKVEETVDRLSEAATPQQRDYLAYLADQLAALSEAEDRAKEAERERQRVMAEGARITEQLRTPSEEYAATLGHLSDMLAQGAINADTYSKATQQAADSFAASQAKTADQTLDLTDSFQGFGQVATSAFEDAIVKGEKLGTVIEGLATDIQHLLLRKSLNKLLDVGLNALSAALSGGGGFSLGGFLTQPLLSAHGNVFNAGELIPFARGGIVDRPTLFPMARGAGLMGEAGPEAIMPLRRLPDGNLGVAGGGAAVVNNVRVINNHPAAQISSDERRNDQGGVDLTVMIDAVEQAMAQRVTRPGSTLNRALAAAANPVRSR